MNEPPSLTRSKKHPESVCKECPKIKENCSAKFKTTHNAKKEYSTSSGDKWKYAIISCAKK